jgi:hypothetical protein
MLAGSWCDKDERMTRRDHRIKNEKQQEEESETEGEAAGSQN